MDLMPHKMRASIGSYEETANTVMCILMPESDKCIQANLSCRLLLYLLSHISSINLILWNHHHMISKSWIYTVKIQNFWKGLSPENTPVPLTEAPYVRTEWEFYNSKLYKSRKKCIFQNVCSLFPLLFSPNNSYTRPPYPPRSRSRITAPPSHRESFFPFFLSRVCLLFPSHVVSSFLLKKSSGGGGDKVLAGAAATTTTMVVAESARTASSAMTTSGAASRTSMPICTKPRCPPCRATRRLCTGRAAFVLLLLDLV